MVYITKTKKSIRKNNIYRTTVNKKHNLRNNKSNQKIQQVRKHIHREKID